MILLAPRLFPLEGAQEVREVVGPDIVRIGRGRAGLPPRVGGQAAEIRILTSYDGPVRSEFVRYIFGI